MFKTDVVYHLGAEIELDWIPADMTTRRQIAVRVLFRSADT